MLYSYIPTNYKGLVVCRQGYSIVAFKTEKSRWPLQPMFLSLREAKFNSGRFRFHINKANSLATCSRCPNEVEFDLPNVEKVKQVKN